MLVDCNLEKLGSSVWFLGTRGAAGSLGAVLCCAAMLAFGWGGRAANMRVALALSVALQTRQSGQGSGLKTEIQRSDCHRNRLFFFQRKRPLRSASCRHVRKRVCLLRALAGVLRWSAE